MTTPQPEVAEKLLSVNETVLDDGTKVVTRCFGLGGGGGGRRTTTTIIIIGGGNNGNLPGLLG